MHVCTEMSSDRSVYWIRCMGSDAGMSIEGNVIHNINVSNENFHFEEPAGPMQI